MSIPKVKVIRAKHSLNTSNPRSNDAPQDSNILYIHPRRKYVVPAAPPRAKKSCVNRFCSGLCNFFNSSRSVEYEVERGYTPPVPGLCYTPSRTNLFKNNDRGRPLQTAVPISRQNQGALISYVGKEEWCNRCNVHKEASEVDDYIIYIPRVSKSDLEQKYLEPLSQKNYEPIFIHRCKKDFEDLSGCCSCSIICDNNDPCCKYANSRSCPKASGPPSAIHSRMQNRLSSSCRPSIETVSGGGRRGQPDCGCARNAQGDTNDCNHLKDKIEDSEGLKIKVLYIPSKSGTSRQQHYFKILDKKICWNAIEQRHDKAALNRQKYLQNIKNRLQTYSDAWSRRKVIGERKKKLMKDNHSILCSPPNMLESRFHHIHWLGNSGNHNNTVGRYFDKEENRVVALKIFSNKLFDTALENLDNKLMAIQEINSLMKLNHKNIIKLLGYFELHDKYHLILESCDHSLREEIDEAPSGLGTSASKKFIKCILNGLNFCHQAKCLHRDLSPENILVGKNGLIKIADFDRSVFIADDRIGNISPTPGSYVYNSPEILAGDKEYGLPSDVWSLGIIFCELLTGKPPWNGKSAQSQLREIHNCVGPLLPRHASVAKLHINENSYTVHNHAQLQQMFTTISAPCCSFIMKCLDVNPLCRYTCGELLQHQFMKGNYK